jgi:hypothetical protein
MREFLEACFSPWTLPFTVLLVLILLYWLLLIIGAVDLEFFDSLIPDMAPDMEPDMTIEEGGHLFGPLLHWLGIGNVPVMILLSFFIFLGWAFSLIANTALNPASTPTIGLLILPLNLAVSLFLAGLIARPFARLFKPETHQQILYSIGVATTSTVTADFGQVEIPARGAPIVINARTTGETVLHKGEKAIVYDKDDEKGIYYVEKYND